MVFRSRPSAVTGRRTSPFVYKNVVDVKTDRPFPTIIVWGFGFPILRFCSVTYNTITRTQNIVTYNFVTRTHSFVTQQQQQQQQQRRCHIQFCHTNAALSHSTLPDTTLSHTHTHTHARATLSHTTIVTHTTLPHTHTLDKNGSL